MFLTGVSIALCLFLSPTALLTGMLLSDGPDRGQYSFVSFPLTYSSFDWYVVI